MAEIGVGVIGFGLACRVFHAPFVQAVPGLGLRAVVARSGDEAAKLYPAAKIFRTVEDLLADDGIGLVVVATPNATHFELARRCLLAGKHVVVDKPLCGTSAEARELMGLAEAKALVLAPFHNRRWDGDFRTVRKVMASGELGRVVTVESHFDRFRPLQREGTWKEERGAMNGLLFDLGPHLVDQALALFGEPESVTASVRSDREGSAIEDAFDIALEYDGLMAWCRSTMVAAEASPRFLLHGTRGSFRKFGLDAQEPALLGGASVPSQGASGEWLREDEALWGTLTLAADPASPKELTRTVVPTECGDYREFYANVRDAVLGVGTLAVTGEDGWRTIRVLEMARVSSREKRTVAWG